MRDATKEFLDVVDEYIDRCVSVGLVSPHVGDDLKRVFRKGVVGIVRDMSSEVQERASEILASCHSVGEPGSEVSDSLEGQRDLSEGDEE